MCWVLSSAQLPSYLLFLSGPLSYSPLAPKAISSEQLHLGYFRPTSDEIPKVRRLATAFFCTDILSCSHHCLLKRAALAMQTWVFGDKMGVISLRVEAAPELEWGQPPSSDCWARAPRMVFSMHTDRTSAPDALVGSKVQGARLHLVCDALRVSS